MKLRTSDAPALIYRDTVTPYSAFTARHTQRLPPGSVVPLVGDFDPDTLTLLFRLIDERAILVPFTRHDSDKLGVATADLTHPYYQTLRERGHAGLVLFTSGSSGKPKAAVHDLDLLLKKFDTPRPARRTLAFLSFDHWGGLNTMFHVLSNGGTLVVPRSRTPGDVCAVVERYKVEVLPVTPSFLNLLLASGAIPNYDLSSIQVISYGTEPMPATTLTRLGQAFPNVRLQQTYGLIELGVLRSQSKASDSPWVRIGGEGYKTRVVDGLLEIKAESAMLGYLNAPSPFTADGWFQTGDAVEVDGEFYRILGRRSELINVGGEKVYPQEVEAVILELPEVADVLVYGEPHALMGNVVCAKVVPAVSLPDSRRVADLVVGVRFHCRQRLDRFKVPVKIGVVESVTSERQKKARRTCG